MRGGVWCDVVLGCPECAWVKRPKKRPRDDKRVLLQHRIEDYERMIADYEEMKCTFTRKVLGRGISEQIGYLLMDEIISVQSRLSTDERQHNFCTYIFQKEEGAWKITLEHCASLPDYNISPNEDALYYFHNPVY